MPPNKINVAPPLQLAGLLERRFGALSARVRAKALKVLVPAIATGDNDVIEAALLEIDILIDRLSAEATLNAMAADVSVRANNRHRKAFTSKLAVAVGMKVLGDDENVVELPPPPPGQEPPPPPAAGRPRGVLVAKLSADPILIAEQFATNNAARISTLNAEIVPALRDEIVRAIQFGISPEEAAERLAKKWAKSGVPVARGNMTPQIRLIVRDQVAKLSSDLTVARAVAAGATRFVWTSQRDSRVRPLHTRLNGQTFTFERGHPTEGLPGQPINCRCWAAPIVETEEVINSPGFIHLAEGEAAIS